VNAQTKLIEAGGTEYIPDSGQSVISYAIPVESDGRFLPEQMGDGASIEP
jgi:hypothetical protein